MPWTTPNRHTAPTSNQFDPYMDGLLMIHKVSFIAAITYGYSAAITIKVRSSFS
jgi:hypothetical protein